MKTEKKAKQIIGRAELLEFPELEGKKVHARIDSGARTSAIWGKARVGKDQKLVVSFFGDQACEQTFTSYAKQAVASSNGHIEVRYAIRLLVVLEGRRIRATFTIANRQTQVYPVLIGRNVLRGKFVVDVTQGTTLEKAEKTRLAELDTLAKKDTRS